MVIKRYTSISFLSEVIHISIGYLHSTMHPIEAVVANVFDLYITLIISVKLCNYMAMHNTEICNVEFELELMGCELIVM